MKNLWELVCHIWQLHVFYYRSIWSYPCIFYFHYCFIWRYLSTFFDRRTGGVQRKLNVQESNSGRVSYQLKIWSFSENGPHQSYFIVSLLRFSGTDFPLSMRELFFITSKTLEQNVIYLGGFRIHGGYFIHQHCHARCRAQSISNSWLSSIHTSGRRHWKLLVKVSQDKTGFF